MTLHYRLSNRQRKDLAIRATELQIAIPIPIDWPDASDVDQLRQFVIDSLPDEHLTGDQIKSVEETSVAVSPPQQPADSPIGHILPDERAAGKFHLVAEVVIAKIATSPKPRHWSTKIEWPGDLSMIVKKSTQLTDGPEQ